MTWLFRCSVCKDIMHIPAVIIEPDCSIDALLLDQKGLKSQIVYVFIEFICTFFILQLLTYIINLFTILIRK